MFSTNTHQKVLSYQSKTNNNRSSNLIVKVENNLLHSVKDIEKAVYNQQYRSSKLTLKQEITSLTSSNTSTDNPNTIMLGSVIKICIVCFLETLKLIQGTLKQIDGRKRSDGSIYDSISSDDSSSSISLKRERSLRKKKYSTRSQNLSSTRNVCSVSTKVNPTLLGKRADRNNLEKLCAWKHEPNMKTDQNGKIDLPKRVRSITFPGDNGKRTTIKVLSATKTPQSCCLNTPAQNYTSLVSSLNGGVQSFDQFLLHATKTLGRGSRKRYAMPHSNLSASRSSPTYRRRSLEVVLEEDE